MTSISIKPEPTPNPNAIKFTTNVTLTDGVARSFYNAVAAAADPIAARLFALEGVTGVMLLRDFCTVNQDGRRDWDQLIPKVDAVLRESLSTS